MRAVAARKSSAALSLRAGFNGTNVLPFSELEMASAWSHANNDVLWIQQIFGVLQIHVQYLRCHS